MPGISEFTREEESEPFPLHCPVAGCDFSCTEEGQAYRSFCGCRHPEPLVRGEEKTEREESL